jgi:hypothetical protein
VYTFFALDHSVFVPDLVLLLLLQLTQEQARVGKAGSLLDCI